LELWLVRYQAIYRALLIALLLLAVRAVAVVIILAVVAQEAIALGQVFPCLELLLSR
jgi:hypothetical protein